MKYLLALDLAKLKAIIDEKDAQFLLAFIRSLPLDAAVLAAIGLEDQGDIKKIRDKGFTKVQSLFDNLHSESNVEDKLGLGPPASGAVWKFTERFTRQVTGKIMLAMLADTFN